MRLFCYKFTAGQTYYYMNDVLLQQLADGQSSAFTTIYNDYYPELYFLSKHLIGDDAPDVLADVFIRLWTQRKLFESKAHLLAYLRVMTRNACFDHLKKQHRDVQQLQELLHISDQEHEDRHFHEIMESRVFTLIRNEIEELPPHMREVFKLAYIDGLKNAEIASLLQMKDAAVRVRKAEALKILRSSLYRIELIIIMKLIIYPPQ